MKIAKIAAAIVAGVLATSPVLAAEDDGKAFGQFQEVLIGIEKRSFDSLQDAINSTDFRNRVYSTRVIEPEAKQAFEANLWQFLEASFMQELPTQGSRLEARVVDFAFQDGRGKAAVRYSLPDYHYLYQIYDLRHDSRGRLRIDDWFNSGTGQMFSAGIAEDLMVLMPTKPATRKTISIENPSDLELFQITEIYKASRDVQPPRFYQIYDQFEPTLKREPYVAKQAVWMAFLLKDQERLINALDIYLDVFSEDPKFGLTVSDFYLAVASYEKAYEQLAAFQKDLPIKEGALPAKLSALALAIGRPEEAEEYAVEATVDEPGLELGWWSLLRARSSAGDFAGSIEPLTYLEDNFEQRLDEAKLRRDKFRGFTQLVASQEFKDWRASRP
jgi:tetratricopeptide (TPR) repeat protein